MTVECHRGPDGRWLVRDGDRRFVVPDQLGKRLDGPDGLRLWRAVRPPPRPGKEHRRGLWLRFTLLPVSCTRCLSRWVLYLVSWPALTASVILGVVGALVVPWPDSWDLRQALLVAGLFLLTAVVHELGHAAALRREGWPPGSIGAGLLWIIPVFWCDVSATALLPRRGRVRVDVAGICLQVGAAGLVGVLARVWGWSAGGLVVRAAFAAVAWSLLPIVRSDGHWLVCDLFGLTDLEAPLPPSTGRQARLALAFWRVIVALATAAVLVLLPWRLGTLLLRTTQETGWAHYLVLGLFVPILGIGGLRAGRRLVRLLTAVWRDRPLDP